MGKYLNGFEEGAYYAGIDKEMLRLACKNGSGPQHRRPSPRTIVFLRSDLDDWVAGWKLIEKKGYDQLSRD